jgi:Cd2+/Zn2+-exporting ATPase
VCFGALALAIFPPLISLLLGGEAGWSTWVYRALSFLVVSCPCALVISIPLSFFGGIGGASTQGVLVKGSNYLEALAETDCVVFDKTGTLTQGVFQVTEVQPAPGIDQQKLLEVAALAERYSNHPISRSLKEAVGVDLSAGRVEDVAEISGHGVTATVEGQSVAVGNGRMMERVGVAYTPCATPGTILYVACDGAYWGYILISDVVKPHAKEAITQLKAAGVTKTVMLTGDNAAMAQVVAEELGVDQVYAGLLPGDKVTKVEELLAAEGKDKKLAFVGDGINDAPVLSRADVGIAMGALGSDAAIEAADIVLMDDDPQKIALAMAIARKTLRIVQENIVLALGVKAVCLILVAVGLANMWAAVFADVGVMVLAVLNAMRALRA